MKILILGGTGAIGAHLTKILGGANSLCVTSRKKRISSENVKYIQGNAHDINKTILKGEHFDVIVDFMSYKTDEFANKYEYYLKNTDQYVFLSSARVYADNGDKLISEESPRLLDVCSDNCYLNTDEYALTKARQENYLINSDYKNWTIIRPYITYSEERLQLGVLEKEAWMFRAVNGHAIVFSKDIIDHVTTLTYGYDVSNAMAAVVGKKTSLGKIFHITGEDCCTWREILDTYIEVITETTKREVNVVLQEKSIRLKSENTKYQVKYDRCYNRRFDNESISMYIDVHSFIPIKQGLTKCVKQFLEKPTFRQINIKEQALFDRISKEVYTKDVFESKKSYFIYLLYRFVWGIELWDLFKQKLRLLINR